MGAEPTGRADYGVETHAEPETPGTTAPEHPDWVVPWADGFLVGSSELSAAGVLLDVRFTTDGVEWEPRDMVEPAGGALLSSVIAVGNRLAVLYGNEDPFTGLPVDATLTVATTTDLTNWTRQEFLLAPPGELPAGITWRVCPERLVANENGWVMSIFEWIEVDPLELLPADALAEIDTEDGFGSSADDRGIAIWYHVNSDSGRLLKDRTLTWDELGVDSEVGRLVWAPRDEPTRWSSSWGGVPRPTPAPASDGVIVATPSGFVLWSDQTWHSPDGIAWHPSPLPDGVYWVSGCWNVDDGLVTVSSPLSGVTLIHHLDERGGNAVLLDIPIPRGDSVSIGGGGGSRTAGTLLAVEHSSRPSIHVDLGGYGADLWLLASLDGERFVVTDLDHADGEPTSLATNGGRLLLQLGTSWVVHDLA